MGNINDRMENWDKQAKNEKKCQVQLWQTRILKKKFKSRTPHFLQEARAKYKGQVIFLFQGLLKCGFSFLQRSVTNAWFGAIHGWTTPE